MNSLQVDRVENSQIKFRTISKRKTDINESNLVPSAIINRRVQSLNVINSLIYFLCIHNYFLFFY